MTNLTTAEFIEQVESNFTSNEYKVLMECIRQLVLLDASNEVSGTLGSARLLAQAELRDAVASIKSLK